MRSSHFTICVAALALFVPGLADASAVGGRSESSAAQGGDEARTLRALHQSNENEREMAALARARSRSQAVKDMADRMLADDRNADALVRAYAQQRDIDLDAPARRAKREIDDQIAFERHARTVGSSMGEWAFSWENEIKRRKDEETGVGELRRLEGREFDRAFARKVVADRQELVDLLASSRARSNDDLRSLIDRLLPDIQEHLSLGQELASNP